MNNNKKLFLVIFCLFFTIYTFSSDGHRSNSDESFLQEQALRIVLQEPDPDYVPGVSGNLFKYPEFWYPTGDGATCAIGILCYPVGIVHSVTAVPFIFLNHHFNFVTDQTVLYGLEDYPDQHYVWWRNSINPDFTFMELFYSPLFSSLSVATFFLISRAFKYKIFTSLSLVFLFGLATSIFSYSQTSFNITPAMFFALAGFLFFKRFIDNQKISNCIFASILLGLGFMVRNDVIFLVIPLFFFLVLTVTFQKTWTLSAILHKIIKIITFSVPLLLLYELNRTMQSARHLYAEQKLEMVETQSLASNVNTMISGFGREGANQTQLAEGLFGLLLSPGVGLFVYVPILLTVFFAFPDFFKTNKIFSILFLAIPTIFLIDFGSMNTWHGFSAWAPKYLYLVIPFLLLPLGASIEKRGRTILPIICVLGGLGFFFNFVNIVQDVTWFVWGTPGGPGLLHLSSEPGRNCAMYVCDEVIWTFQYSPLFASIHLALTNLIPDVFLLKLFGLQYYFLTLVSILSAECYLLYRILKSKNISRHESKSFTEDNI